MAFKQELRKKVKHLNTLEEGQVRMHEKSSSILRCLETELATLELRTKMLSKKVQDRAKALEQAETDLQNFKEIMKDTEQ